MATGKKTTAKAKTPISQTRPQTPAIDVPARSEGQTITFAERGHQTMVRKSNQLVQMAMYNLTTQQQKIMLHIFAMIQPTDEELPRYVFRVSDFCKMCNIDPHSGHLYKQIKEDLLALKNSNSAFINIPGTEIDHAFDWLHTVDINRATKEIYITLDPVLKPHLIQLKSLYTTLDLTYTMSMRSQYSIRIYELCKSYQNLYQANKKNGLPLIWDTEKLRQQIACPYTSFNDLDRWALKKAKKEIAQFTDIVFDYEIYQRGAHGKVSEISVSIEPKSAEELEVVLNEIAKRMKKSRRLSKQDLLAEERAYEDALDAERAEEAEEAEDSMSLGYISAPDTTIVYSVALNRDEMLRELALRANYEKLTAELSEAECAALDILIQTMADMAADDSNGQEMKNGGNKEFFLAMNDVIYNSRGEYRLYPWFKAVIPRYAREVLPLAQTKPIQYLYKCIMNDLKNYRLLLLEQPKAALPQKEPMLELEAREAQPGGDSPYLTEADAATEKSMVEAIRRRLDLTAEEALSDGQLKAYRQAVQHAAALCRRTDPVKDAGYIANGCNMKFLNRLNYCIEQDKLTALFLAIAQKLDMDTELKRIRELPGISDPMAFYLGEVEKCIAAPDLTLEAAGKRGTARAADNRAVTRRGEELPGQTDLFARLEQRPRRMKRKD